MTYEDNLLQRALSGEAFLLFDGAMGTMLQERGLKPGQLPELLCLQQPEIVTDVHRAYVQAGSHVVTTNTFGANADKLGDAATVDEVFAAAIECARKSGARYVAADIGPTGELIFPMGELGFTQAYRLFAEQAAAAERAGADLVIIETMADILEMTAAVMAVKDSCKLPVFATMTFTSSGRTFLGTAPSAAALALVALGVDALGVNCSAGPVDLQPVVQEMLKVSPVPVIVQANAGLPQVVDGRSVYSLEPADYAADVLPMAQAGATIIGGCCGTNPEYISCLSQMLKGQQPQSRPLIRDDALALAREFADDEGGRDGEIVAAILDASDFAALREEFAEEYDLD